MQINYTRVPKQGERLYNYVQDVPGDLSHTQCHAAAAMRPTEHAVAAEHLPKPSNLEHDLHEVTVNNLAHPDFQSFKPSLQRNGFTLAKLQVPQGIDWSSEESVRLLVLGSTPLCMHHAR